MEHSITFAREALANNPEAQRIIAETDATVAAELGIRSSDYVAGSSAEANVQIVDEHQAFTTALEPHMKTWKLNDAGFSYDVVAVFGSQSTGKSTLLNRLFGTKFDVMNENERRQTTKGIWMSKAEGANVLVMDVEGTDGRERGEDQDFERKSALFSMAVTEVLVVNIWEHQVGLYQGANMGLLKTVFDVNLNLFLAAKQKGKVATTVQDKTLLLFTIRDHIGATPLANLRATLEQDLNRLWDGLAKPEGLDDCKITTFFDLAFVALPHKLLQPDQFESEVKKLRQRFVDPKDPNYVFQPKYHKRIPADGISQYMSTIWDAVVTNKDLDLPTQQELLAQFRCDEIADAAFATFVATTETFVQGTSKDMGPVMEKSRTVALETFDAAASRYHSSVYQRKRAELLGKLNAVLSPFFLSYLKTLHKTVLRDFRKAIQEGLKVDGYDFGKVVQQTRSTAEADFIAGAKSVLLSDTNWSYEDTLVQLQEDIVSVADLLRAQETAKMLVAIERTVKKHVGETVESYLNKPSSNMWDKIIVTFKATLEKAEAQYVKKAISFNCTPEENETALYQLRKRSWLVLRAKVDEQTADAVLLARLKFVFEDRFRYDDEGVPRVWKPEDDIDAIFKKAKDSVLALIPLYATIKPQDPENEFSLPSSTDPSDLENPEFDFPSTLVILSPTTIDNISSRFRREADAYYIEAKRSMVSSISQIPYWMYGVLAVLGWNEFVAVLRNPLYFTLLLLLGAAAYITIQLNMTGPVLTLARGITREIVRTVNEVLHTHFNPPQLEQPHVARQREHVAASPSGQVPEEIELKEKPKAE